MRTRWIALGLAVLASACGGEDPEPEAASWEIVREDLPGALLSVWGTSADDIWAVGANPGTGSTVLRRENGGEWKEVSTGTTSGDLWWVFGFEGGPVYMGGSAGTILRYQNGAFAKMRTPGRQIVFGIWGPSPDEVWAVGGEEGGASGGFAWKLSGDEWIEAPGFPKDQVQNSAVWKLYGRGPNDVWLVGTLGLVVHWDGTAFELGNAGVGESLFTVTANDERFEAVGGFGTGLILENDGTGWVNVSPSGIPAVIGVCSGPSGELFAVGADATVLTRGESGWAVEKTNLAVFETYHACWVDPSGGVWAVGGRVTSFPLVDGVLVHRSLGGKK